MLNRHVRTISRLIVHPQFRGIGLAGAVARALIAHCPTRYTEAISRLGQHHGLFAAAGMEDLGGGYFLHDRSSPMRGREAEPRGRPTNLALSRETCEARGRLAFADLDAQRRATELTGAPGGSTLRACA
jgi:hypothetical protein